MNDIPPAHLLPYFEKIDAFYRAEVAPREKKLEHRLTDSLRYIDENGLLHPEIQRARREIQRASGAAGLFAGGRAMDRANRRSGAAEKARAAAGGAV